MVDPDSVLFFDAPLNLLQRMKARAEYSILRPGEDAIRAHRLRTQSRSSKESTLKCSRGEIAAHALHLDDFDRTPSSVVHGRYSDLRSRLTPLAVRRALLRPSAFSLIGTARLLAKLPIRTPIHASSPSFRVTCCRPFHGPFELLRESGRVSAFPAAARTTSQPTPRAIAPPSPANRPLGPPDLTTTALACNKRPPEKSLPSDSLKLFVRGLLNQSIKSAFLGLGR